ncbi:MAG: hypothetical protein QM765_35115 [Myxococcales bacterium]
MRGTSFAAGLLAAVLASVGAAGCMTTGAAGPGASTGIAVTNRGAETEVAATADHVERHAQQVLQKQGIKIAESQTAPVGAKRVLAGKKGNVDVVVTMTETASDNTHVDVVAQKSAMEWDKDLARRIAQDISKG